MLYVVTKCLGNVAFVHFSALRQMTWNIIFILFIKFLLILFPWEGSIGNVEHSACVSSLEIPDEANSAESYEMDLLEMSVYLLNLDENLSDFENEFDDELDLLLSY